MKKALVTGASTGLGLEFAKQLKDKGYLVTGVARSKDKLESLFDEGNFIVADLTEEGGISRVLESIEQTSYDLCINNAGFGMYGHFTNMPVDRQIEMIQLNIRALVSISHSFLKNAKSGDALLNVSSALSLLPMPGSAVYSGTKAFVTAFSECLWYEYKNKGIKVFTDMPGPVATPFHEVAGGSTESMDPKMVQSPQEVVKEALRKLESGRISVVNGFPFKMFTRFGQLLTRKKRIEVMARYGPVEL